MLEYTCNFSTFGVITKLYVFNFFSWPSELECLDQNNMNPWTIFISRTTAAATATATAASASSCVSISFFLIYS
jgi:hypothetical protein